jgi:hypothetical protein
MQLKQRELGIKVIALTAANQARHDHLVLRRPCIYASWQKDWVENAGGLAMAAR